MRRMPSCRAVALKIASEAVAVTRQAKTRQAVAVLVEIRQVVEVAAAR